MDYRAEVKKKMISMYGREPNTLDELGELVIMAINRVFIEAECKRRVLGMKWSVTRTNVRTSHDAPIGQKTSWSSEEAMKNNIPTYAPGWEGRVWIAYSDQKADRSIIFGSDPFGATLTYPGTGGYGSYDGPWKKSMVNNSYTNRHTAILPYSWDYRFYMSDWPNIMHTVEKDIVFSRISGKPDTTRFDHHTFFWEDDTIKDLTNC